MPRLTFPSARVLGPLFAAAALAGCKPAAESGPAPTPAGTAATAPPAAVREGKLHTGPIDRTITLPAVVQPWQQATLCAKVAGYVQSISVDKGDAVEAGQVVAELEAPELLADRSLHRAEAGVARRDWDRLTAAQAKAGDLILPQAVDDARGRYETAAARLERVETLLSYTRLKAPFAGLVARRYADPGAFLPAATAGVAATNAALLTLVDVSRLRIQAGVPEMEARRILVGAPAVASVDEIPGRTFPGTVARFEAALDPGTATLLTEVVLTNADQSLRPGMHASLALVVERKARALLAPAAAVGRDKSGPFVFLLDQGRARRTPVVTGFANAADVEIVSGVPETATPLISAGGPLSDGQAVRLADTP